MDALAEAGSRWFCTAARTVGATSFEMQTCTDSGTRYWIGVLIVFAAVMLAIVTLWRFAFRERSVA